MRKILDDPIFEIEPSPTSEKVISLKDAVSRYVRPGMLIHTGQTSIRWCSAIYYEIARQFWGKGGDITLVGVSMNFPQSVLVHGGIVRKIITSYCGDPYYAPSPNRVYLQAFKDGRLEIENWSIYTIALRLQAAALGVPFLPTHSLVGSDMERDNKDDFIVIDDPFQSGKKTGMVRAIHPDLSVIHAWMADPEGNAIFPTPLADNLYGSMASKEGVILTTEKIVSTETIRKYSHIARLPGNYVKSVTEVPFGSHPSGMSRVGLDWMELYAEDYEFVEESHQAAKDPELFQKWVDKWVLSCKDHNDYIKKLGIDRILKLKGRSHLNSWRFEIDIVDNIPDTEEYTNLEMAIVAMGRKLVERIVKGNYQTVLAGAGIANLGAWLSYYLLKEQGHSIDLMAEVGLYGYIPRPTDPALFNLRNVLTCKITTDIFTVIGLFVGGENGNCIGALGAGQVDEKGNINTTMTAKDKFIVGSGGGNDVASRAIEVITIVGHGKSRLPKDVYYITSPGKTVRTAVTTMGIFEKLDPKKGFTLTGFYPQKGKNKEEIVQEITDRCQWTFDVSPDLEEISRPKKRELDLVRIFDPRRYYLGALPGEK